MGNSLRNRSVRRPIGRANYRRAITRIEAELYTLIQMAPAPIVPDFRSPARDRLADFLKALETLYRPAESNQVLG